MRRRIWSETLPYEKVRDPGVLARLRRHGVGLLLAVRPDDRAGVRDVVAACADAGVDIGIWPMIADARGRWANAKNAAEFCAFVLEVVDALGPGVPGEVVVDLEPAIDDVRALLDGARGAGRLIASSSDRDAFADASKRYGALANELRARAIRATAVAVPLVLLGGEWEQLMGTPVSAPGWDSVATMLYSSILEGWSRGLLKRDDAVAILAAGCRTSAAKFGPRAGVALGAVGVGAFGDEPVYRDASELARDVGIARACGVEDLTLFDLGGVLARAPAESWLTAFVETPAARDIPGETLRGRAVLSLAGLTAASVRALLPLLRRYARTGASEGSR